MKATDVSLRLYIRNGLARRISLFGEKLKQDWLIYNPLTMRHFHDEALHNAPRVASVIVGMFPTARVIVDVGSGSGAFVAEFNRLGRSSIGLERSRHGRALAQAQGVDCRDFDLNRREPAYLPEAFDLICCLEVAEHLPATLGDKLVSFIASFQRPVVFSAASPGQGGTGHLNERPPEYWAEKFAAARFTLDLSRTEDLRRQCAVLKTARWFETNLLVLFPS